MSTRQKLLQLWTVCWGLLGVFWIAGPVFFGGDPLEYVYGMAFIGIALAPGLLGGDGS